MIIQQKVDVHSAFSLLSYRLDIILLKPKMEVSFLGKELKLDNEEDGEEIANAIKNCRDMETLKLQGNTLGVGASKVISEALKQQSAFKKALWSDMYTGRLRSEIPKSLELLSEGIITAGAKLTVLDLSDNAFGPDGVDGIKKLLRSESSYLLHTLKLNNNGLGIGGGKVKKLIHQIFV
eukprot:TCONS_00041392-protein